MRPGTRLGPYEILEQLGKGGMGEVYLARDTRLGRRVAIKILPPEFAQDTERLTRFETEARAAAALNHPHIAAVFDIGRAVVSEAPAGAETNYIVQEFLEGETLGSRLDRGPVPLRHALELAGEIVEAIGAAHRANVVHRDLKPENIFITEDGHAKVLDFGLAKLTAPVDSAEKDLSMSPTAIGTMAGQVMGTAGYMAPEQIHGEEVDARTDVFGFGAILHELATGTRAFPGKSVPDVLARILHEEPGVETGTGSAVPAELQRILRKCLAKEPARRYQSTEDLRIDLRNLALEVEAGRAVVTESATSAGAKRAPRALLAAVAGAAFLGGAALFALVGGWLTGGESEQGTALPVQADLLVRPAERIEGSVLRTMAFTPDGETLIFAGTSAEGRQLYRRELGASTATPIAGTEGGAGPVVSPDGEWLLFYSDGALRRVTVAGGQPEVVRDLTAEGPDASGVGWANDLGPVSITPYGLTWQGSDQVVYSRFQGGLWRVPAAGGDPEPLTTLEGNELNHRLPFALPDGALLFTANHRILSHDSRIEVLTPDGSRRRVIDNGSDARFVPPDMLLFARDGALMGVRFDPDDYTTTGDPERLLADIAHQIGGNSPGAASGAAQYDLSAGGALAFLPGGTIPNSTGDIAWVDSDGQVELVSNERASYLSPKLSPDGTQVLVAAKTTRDFNSLTLIDVELGSATILVEEAIFGIWARDGESVIHAMRSTDGSQNIFRTPVDGSTPPRELVGSPHELWPSSLTPDNRTLLYVETNPETGNDVWLLDLEDGAGPRPLLNTPADEKYPAVSPDGAWLVYTSNEQGEDRVFVQPFPGPGPKTHVSAGGGPLWSRDGDSIFLRRRGEDGLWRVPFDRDTGRPSAPRQFTSVVIGGTTPVGGYDIDATGQRLLAGIRPGTDSAADGSAVAGSGSTAGAQGHVRLWVGWRDLLEESLRQR